MYATRPMSKAEIALVKKTSPFAGMMGHLVAGYRADGTCFYESDSETRVASDPQTMFIRRKMPNGKYIYRKIEERP